MTAAQTTYDSDVRRRPLITEFQNFWHFRGLIRLLVVKELTVRYKRSVLGVWWTILNPMLQIGVLWVVFSNFFGRGDSLTFGEPYIIYLAAGIILSTYFAQGLIAAGSAIVNSRGVLVKIYIPPEIFSLAAGVAAATHFCLSLIPLLLLQLILGYGIPLTALLIPIPIVFLLMLVTGVGLLVASAAVYFHDVLDITDVLTQLLNYLIPTFWTLSLVENSPTALFLVKANPVYSYLVVFRTWVYGGQMPATWNLVVMVVSGIVALTLGVYVFSRNWRRVVVRL